MVLLVILIIAFIILSAFILARLEKIEKHKYMLVADNKIHFFKCFKEAKFFIISDECVDGFYSLFVRDKDDYICITKEIER